MQPPPSKNRVGRAVSPDPEDARRASLAEDRNMSVSGDEPFVPASDSDSTLPVSDSAAAGPAGADGATNAPLAISRKRLLLVDALIWVTTVLGIVAIFAVWANRQLLSPDNWANTSTQLLQDGKIRSATANYMVDQLYANVDVAALLKSGLPTQFQPLAGPAAGALQNVAVQGAELALSRPRVQTLWEQANRAAAQTLVAIVNGGKGAVKVNGGRVSLDLASIVDQVASRLGLPAGISSKLPPSIAHLTVLKSDQLKLVQNGGKALRGLALALTIIVPLLYVLAIVLARGHRRRTLMTVGFAGVFAGVLVLLGRSILESQVTSSLVSDDSIRPAVHDAVAIGTSMLSQVASAVIITGLVLVLAAWFAGPSRPMTAVRRAITPFLRDHPDRAFGLTAAMMALIFIWQPIHATGTPAGIIVFLALALFGTWVLRRQVIAEFPDARAGETMTALRARVQSVQERRHHGASSGAGHGGVSDQLERLAALRDRGSINDEEYQSAKSMLLGAASPPGPTAPEKGS
jgi:hypothetical protein